MNKNQIDHDRLFKELLETFFAEFMQLFFPNAYQAKERLKKLVKTSVNSW
jgi:hypothetical protein